MNLSIRTGRKLIAIFSIIILTLTVAFSFSHPAFAAKKTTVEFTPDSVQKVKSSGKKLEIYGKAYKENGKYTKVKWFKYKLNSKTKYEMTVATDTGEADRMTKKAALKKLKKNKSYIAAFITAKKDGTIIRLRFGA